MNVKSLYVIVNFTFNLKLKTNLNKLTVVWSVDEYNTLIKQKQSGLTVHRPIEVDTPKKPDSVKRTPFKGPGGLPRDGVIIPWKQMIEEALLASPDRQELVAYFKSFISDLSC